MRVGGGTGRGRAAKYLPRDIDLNGSMKTDAEPLNDAAVCAQAAALTLPVGTDAIVFRICEAIW